MPVLDGEAHALPSLRSNRLALLRLRGPVHRFGEPVDVAPEGAPVQWRTLSRTRRWPGEAPELNRTAFENRRTRALKQLRDAGAADLLVRTTDARLDIDRTRCRVVAG